MYAQTEAFRTAGVDRLGKYLASNTSDAKPRGEIAGTSTSNTTGFHSVPAKGKSLLSNAAQAAAAAALFVFKNVTLFYPILAFLILGALYLLARKIRRRSRED